MKKRILLGIVLLVLVLTPTFVHAEEVTVPFGAIKSSCYGKIDMSKAEFALSKVGKECVTESWLEENLDEKMDPWGRRIVDEDEKIENVHITDLKSKYIGKSSGEIKAARPAKWCRDRLLLKRGYITKNLKGKFLVPKAAIKDEFLKEIDSEKEKVIAKENWIKQEYFESPEKYKDLDWLLNKSQPSLEEVVGVVDTAEELLTFMNSYFSIKFHKGHTAYSPRRFLQIKKGDCKDWAVFAGHVLKENGYKAKQLVYSLQSRKGGHLIAAYWSDDKIYHISTRLKDAAIFGPFNSIEELLQNEVERSTDISQKIICYVLAPPTKLTVEKHCLYAD